MKYIYEEIKILSKSNNVNIIQYKTHFETEKNIFIIMEYCESSLDEIWEHQYHKKLPEATVINIFR